MKTIQTKWLPEFQKEFKALKKKYKTLGADFQIFLKTQIKLTHDLNLDNRAVFQIPRLGFSEPKIFKVKKFACRSLKGKGARSGLRIIYAYFEEENKIEFNVRPPETL